MKQLLKLTKEHIILDYIDTWPNSILTIIQENISAIENYLKIEAAADEQIIEDVHARVNKHQNKFEVTYNDIIKEIQLELKNKLFIGFHCTKITEFENRNIKKNGLKPLTKVFLEDRLLKLKEKKLINMNTYLYLKDNNLSEETSRKDRVSCIHCINTLKNSSGLSKFFKFWGGEALYRGYEGENYIIDDVSLIGNPSIILCSVGESDINKYNDIPEKMIKKFVNRENTCSSNSCLKKGVKVLGIINSEDPLFETLTNYSEWEK